jgi:hypothetical protein
MKIAKFLLFPSIISLILFSPVTIQAANPECLQHCQEMLSHAEDLCCQSLPLFAIAGPAAFLASGGCFASALAAYGVCVCICNYSG